FAPGKVYVVEFWATWCTPCKENIPHLTALAAKYGDAVSINGISIFESNDPTETAYLKKVETFVKGQGDRMVYNVAVDGPKGEVGNDWMKAADEGGLPTSFIVGKDGRIAWIGHPKDLESVLTQVVEDRYDIDAARTRRAKDVETTRPIHEAMTAKDYPRAITLMDAAVAKRPEDARLYEYDRLVALFHADPKAAMTAADTIERESVGDIGAYRMLASIFASQKDLARPTYVYGKALIARALVKDEMTYMFLAMAAEVNASLGDLAGAVTMQERAVATAEKDSHAPAEFVTFLRKNLEGFRTQLKNSPKSK
ncbi:redoxin domain-containing protein, partial [bacterium]